MIRTTLALLAVLALPGPASAAEGFAGVTERGSLVASRPRAPYSLTTPKRPTGLAPGERIVAMGRAERGVVAVGSSARLYARPHAGRRRGGRLGAPRPAGARDRPRPRRLREIVTDTGQTGWVRARVVR